METPPPTPPRKKRGPAPRLGPVVQSHVYLSEELLEWAKQQKGGLSALVRRLLTEERERQTQRGREVLINYINENIDEKLLPKERERLMQLGREAIINYINKRLLLEEHEKLTQTPKDQQIKASK